mgnify:CR=1 FL=1
MTFNTIESPSGLIATGLVMAFVALGAQHLAGTPLTFGRSHEAGFVQVESSFVHPDGLDVLVFVHQNSAASL